jgi:hypothetical protein
MPKTRFIGKCIYCGSTAAPLRDEHTVPFALNGRSVLKEASCLKCADITSAFETIVLRETLFAARAAVGAKTRHRKKRDQKHPMYIVVDGQERRIEAPWQEHWKIIPLPVFEPPAFLDGRDYKGGIEAHRMDIAWVGESPQEIAKLHNADDVLFKMRSGLRVATAFAKLVAKIAYSSAVMEFGVSGIQEPFIVPAILGKSDDLGKWVGCDRQRIMGTEYNLWHTKLEVARGIILARVKLFARADGTEYVAVVGRISEVRRSFYQSLGYKDA